MTHPWSSKGWLSEAWLIVSVLWIFTLFQTISVNWIRSCRIDHHLANVVRFSILAFTHPEWICKLEEWHCLPACYKLGIWFVWSFWHANLNMVKISHLIHWFNCVGSWSLATYRSLLLSFDASMRSKLRLCLLHGLTDCCFSRGRRSLWWLSELIVRLSTSSSRTDMTSRLTSHLRSTRLVIYLHEWRNLFEMHWFQIVYQRSITEATCMVFLELVICECWHIICCGPTRLCRQFDRRFLWEILDQWSKNLLLSWVKASLWIKISSHIASFWNDCSLIPRGAIISHWDLLEHIATFNLESEFSGIWCHSLYRCID